MSGDTPFDRGPMAQNIGLDRKSERVEEMLQGTFVRDEKGLDKDTAL